MLGITYQQTRGEVSMAILRNSKEQAWSDAVNALLWAVGDAAQEAETLRQSANGDWQCAGDIEERIAVFSLKAASVRNRFHELEQVEG